MLLVEAVAVNGFAAAAVALFLTRSILLEPIRGRLTGLAAEGASCAFCASFWAAGALTWAYPASPWPLAWLASWGFAALVAAAIDRLVGD